jgi:hypothetical protein
VLTQSTITPPGTRIPGMQIEDSIGAQAWRSAHLRRGTAWSRPFAIEDGSVLPIKQKHLTEALKGAKPTTLEWLSQARNYAKYANEGGLYDDVTAFLDKHAK